MQTYALSSSTAKFTVYAYIPWAGTDSLLTYGIKPISVIYEKNYLTNGVVDREKIKKLALSHSAESHIPVSFDTEFEQPGQTKKFVAQIKEIITEYRHYNAKALVGLYATIPKNTYGKIPPSYLYQQANSVYDSLIDYVDYISPSLYNYKGHDLSSWVINARFNLQTAKQYEPSKPIIPYISPVFRQGASSYATNGHLVELLDEDEMSKQLAALKKLGASGCIIWASSQDRTQDGKMPQFDPNNGWGKAVVEFIRELEVNNIPDINFEFP